jgi:uncharacterized SAM-binding protein YcdF (DUF218 family)
MHESVLINGIVSAVLLPPLNLVLLCIAGWFLRRRWPRAGVTMSACALGALLVLSTKAGALLLVTPLEQRTAPLSVPRDSGAQAIVVLGAGRQSRAPEYGGKDSPNAIELVRLRYAAKLHRETGLPILVAGGTLDDATESEAAGMARSLREDFRTPVQWLEERSTTTAENAAFSARILQAAGIRRILLVTDAMHIPRSRAVFETTGLEVVPAPTAFFSVERRTALDFVPSGEGLRRSHYAMHEWIGLQWYRWAHGRTGARRCGTAER